MKDYSLNYDDSKKFILSYKIENGKIVAKLASGESYTVPYSEENKNKIISRMEEQARYAQPKPLKMQDSIWKEVWHEYPIHLMSKGHRLMAFLMQHNYYMAMMLIYKLKKKELRIK